MKVEFLDRGLESGQQTDGKTNPARGVQNIYAAADPCNAPGKIIRALLQKPGPFLFTDDRMRHFEEGLGGDWLAGGLQFAANTNGGRERGFQVQIAGALALSHGYE